MMQLGSWQRRIFCTSVFLTISGVSCNITAGTFQAAPRRARKAASAARRAPNCQSRRRDHFVGSDGAARPA